MKNLQINLKFSKTKYVLTKEMLRKFVLHFVIMKGEKRTLLRMRMSLFCVSDKLAVAVEYSTVYVRRKPR